MTDIWRKTPPTKPGWYWCALGDSYARLPGSEMADEVVACVDGGLQMEDCSPLSSYAWWGPAIPSAEELARDPLTEEERELVDVAGMEQDGKPPHERDYIVVGLVAALDRIAPAPRAET